MVALQRPFVKAQTISKMMSNEVEGSHSL